jgi:ribonucleoside-triphosphate reductase
MQQYLGTNKDFQQAFSELKEKYDEQFFKIEGLTPEQLDPLRFYRNFLGSKTIADISVDASSNVYTKDINTMMKESEKSQNKLICFNKMFVELKEQWGIEVAKEWLEQQINGAIYTHDSDTLTFKGYCYAFSMEDVAKFGMFWSNRMKSDPSKHASTFNYHTLQFVSQASNTLSGAVGIPDLLIYMFYFYKKDVEAGIIPGNLKDYYKKQFWQQMIFNLNQEFLRDSIQSAYTNISVFDREYFIGMFGDKTFPDGSFMIDFLEEFMKYQEEFLDYMIKLRKDRFFTYPVLTASLIFKDGKYQDEHFAKIVAKHNCEFGDANVYISDTADNLSSCCRLKNDTSLLTGNFNSIGGTSLSIGSIKVITLNLVRCALQSKDIGEFYDNIIKTTKLIHKSLYTQRKIIQKNIDKGLYPLYTHRLIKIENQYSTLGINGVWESIKLLGGTSEDESGEYYTDYGKEIAANILNLINDLNIKFSETVNFTINAEQVPFESGSIKNCKKDNLLFPNNKLNTDIYGNQWIPLNVDSSLFHRLEMSAILDKEASGGSILHRNRINTITPEQNYQDMVAMAKMGIVYYSDIVKMNICANEHTYVEESDICSICGAEKVDESVKIVGYLTRKSSYQKERKQEMEERKFYKV